jgi:diacylglycerol kinase family enzyme
MSGLAIIANPHAHRNRLWPLASQALRKAAPGVPLLETRGPRELQQAAKQIAAERPRVVAIAGGDGTVTHTVTALAAALGDDLPLLALLGGGAYDSLAPLGGPGDAEDRLRRLSEALSSGVELEVLERDTLRIEVPDGSAVRCGFRFGTGLPVRFIEAIYSTGSTGPWTSARVLAKALGSSAFGGKFARKLFAPLDLRVSLDGEEWPRVPIYGLVCSTVAEAGLGLRPFRRATEQPGAFEVLGLTAGPRKFAFEIPRMLAGLHARRDRLLNGVAEKVELSASGPLGWFLDGEVVAPSSKRLVVGLGPRVKLVRA